MPLIYITGPTASGKSTVCNKLRELGYETYDTDKGGIRYWLNEKTGEPIKAFKKGEIHDKFWMNQHRLGLPKSWLEKLKADSAGKVVFICGTSPIDHTDTGLYDKIIVLSIDEETLISRVKTRTDNNYGKNPRQLDKAVKWRQSTIDRYKQVGAYEIDSNLPVDKIVSKILSLTKVPEI